MFRLVPLRDNVRDETGTYSHRPSTQEESAMHRLSSLLMGALLAGALGSAAAEELAVGNYGVSANGMPFGVALHKGYFKEEGLNITGLITSAGGGTSLRNMLAGGGAPYGEVKPGVVILAILGGAETKFIRQNVQNV